MAMKTATLDIPFPDEPELTLVMGLGACKLAVRPADQPEWVKGTYKHPEDGMLPEIVRTDGLIEIKQKKHGRGLPALFFRRETPEFDITLGKAMPYALRLEGGAAECTYELGGLPLADVDVAQGAGKFTVLFSEANPQRIPHMKVKCGAGKLTMQGLANANFEEMEIDVGVGGYAFDFSGTLQQDARVQLNAGVSQVTLNFPPGLAARIEASTTIGGLDMGDGFMKKDGAIWTEAALNGQTPVLTIEASVSLGQLNLCIGEFQDDD